MRGSALLAGQLAGVVVLGAAPGGRSTSPSGCCSGVRLRARARRDRSLLLVSPRSIALGFGALGVVPRAAHRLGRGDPGPLPAPVRLPLHLVDEHAAEPDRASTGSASLATRQPGLVPDRVRPQPDHHRLGRARRSRSASASPSLLAVVSLGAAASGRSSRGWSGREGLAGRLRRRVADAEERASRHPSLLLPVADVPAVLLHRVRGRPLAGRRTCRASTSRPATPRSSSCFVLLQSAAFGGVFTGFGDRARLRGRLRPAAAARGAEPHRDRRSATRSAARRCAGRSRRPCSPCVALVAGMEVGGGPRRRRRPVHARRCSSTSPGCSGRRASRCASGRSRPGR